MKQAIQKIMAEIKDECVITSCGYISREVYHVKDRARNFYMLGSMGGALGFGLGLAYQRPDLEVIVISGDGAVLMSLGTVVLDKYLHLKNIEHWILQNNSYASTGGQYNCFEAFRMDYGRIFRCNSKSNAPRIPLTCKQIKERFENSIRLRD